MPEAYLSLSHKDQAQILRSQSINTNLGLSAIILEKDIWLCWALEHLFKMPDQLPMAFKGGTSLSKVFQVINRFSEDVDITIDYKAFNCEDPFAQNISKSKIRKISDQIKEKVTDHLEKIVLPYYNFIISEQFKKHAPTIELDDDGETIHLRYASVIAHKSAYISDSIRIEFGGRNLTIPNKIHTIKSYISEHLKNITFPTAEAIVLSPEKTFWEKLTLIHSECNRTTLKIDADRISRHWYDVTMMMNHDIGKQAILNRELLNEVIKIKNIFYYSSYAKYDDCLKGDFRLLPSNGYLNLLKTDFNKMIDNKMFYGEKPDFDKIINQIGVLQIMINTV